MDLIAIFGANGRTGVELVRAAREAGLEVRPIARDDRDVHRLRSAADIDSTSYADPDHPASLPAVLRGVRYVVSCIDPRTAGPGAPLYGPRAAEAVVRAAGGARRILHLSVMGAWRWSPAPLNRRAFQLENGVRSCDASWAIIRVSCYHDELIEAHVRPPDGGRPHPFPRSSLYAPISRRDAARLALRFLLHHHLPGRTPTVGGPRVFTGNELRALAPPYTGAAGRGARTRYAALPPGDVSVEPQVTFRVAGFAPTDTLEDRLARDTGAPRPAPKYRDPTPHPADRGGRPAALAGMGPALRRALHQQLVEDLRATGLEAGGAVLDFSGARPGERSRKAADGVIRELKGVRLLGPAGQVLHRGDVTFLHDEPADELLAWWDEGRLPERIWRRLDMGVRRRLSADERWRDDPLVAGR